MTTKTYHVTAYPYVRQEGEIEIPANVTNVEDYICAHFTEIKFRNADVDYKGTDFDFEEV